MKNQTNKTEVKNKIVVAARTVGKNKNKRVEIIVPNPKLLKWYEGV